MDSNTPLYTDRSRTSFIQWMGPGVVAYLVIHAFITNQGVALVMAVPLAFYVVFTWHSGYELHRDALVVRYLWPGRRMVVPMAEIALARETRVFPAGDGLLIGRQGKAPVFIRPRDASRLRELLEEHIQRRPKPRVEQPRPEPESDRPRQRPPRPKRRGPPRR